MKIVIAGAKGAGKSTVAKHLERLTGLKRVETDLLIEDHFWKQYGQHKTCREIYNAVLVYLKADAETLWARLCSAIMTLGAVKGIEVGRGFALTRMRGSQSNDNMADGGFLTNNAGGISTGQTVELRIAVKPTSSIASPQTTLDLNGKTQPIEMHGRHDPCIVPRIIPVIEAMASLVLLDCIEIQRRIRPNEQKS